MTSQSHELLPRKAEDFRKQEYWDQFFQKRGEKAFEWYGDYASLRPGLQALLGLPDDAPSSLLRRLKAKVRVLVVGCGNSALSADLAADGFSSLLSVDFSERVIDEMRLFIRKADTKEPDAKTLLQQLHDHGRRHGKAQNAPRYVDDELCELIRDIQITN
ncbi:Microcephalin [Phytophthora nicotianae]|uniref:Microcephalin n=1 Tax=Phytophthora nicotianae TaxID=4792 RepID=A0A0W8D5C4_PHYNI|nr:Microcephalin [Phytophthora nicotianae]